MTRTVLRDFWHRRANIVYVAIMLVAAALMTFCVLEFGWTASWTFLKVPTLYPPFGDMRIIQAAGASLSAGLDPQISNPSDPWQRALDYPEIWGYIAQFLHFENDGNALAFAIGSVAVLWGILCTVIYRYPSIWILLAVFSNSILLLIERGNNDIIVFCLTYFAAVTGIAAFAVLLIALATILKIYPLFSAAHLIRHKKALIVLAVCAVAIMVSYLPQLHTLRGNVSLTQQLSYGTQALAEFLKQRWHIICSPELLLALHFPFIAWLLKKPHLLAIAPAKGGEEKLFLAGGGVFLASFVLSCNWDYRLIFMIPSMPYLSRLTHRHFRRIVMAAIIVSMNYMWCESHGMKWIKLNMASKSFLFIVIAALFCRELLSYDEWTRSLWLRLPLAKKKNV